MSFKDWYHRHLESDPMEPASPPPFREGDRVVVSSEFEDSAFITGSHGKVISAEFTTDPEDEYGPWVIRVLLDGDSTPMKFAAHELTRETGPAEAPTPMVVTVTQPEDVEDFAADEPVPYVPTETVVSPSLLPWIQRAKELRFETLPETPVFDQVREDALSADGLAAEVEAYLASVAGGAA